MITFIENKTSKRIYVHLCWPSDEQINICAICDRYYAYHDISVAQIANDSNTVFSME